MLHREVVVCNMMRTNNYYQQLACGLSLSFKAIYFTVVSHIAQRHIMRFALPWKLFRARPKKKVEY